MHRHSGGKGGCSGRKLSTVAAAALAGLFLAAAPALAYNPPDGPDNTHATESSPKAHGTILLQGIQILKNDGYSQMGDYFYSHRQALLDGMRQADKSGGQITVDTSIETGFGPADALLAIYNGFLALKKEIPANTMAHFYNPDTGYGLQLFHNAGALSAAKDFLEYIGVGDWKTWTLFGPMPSATDMCDYFYARAVESMRHDNQVQAMVNLGNALHYIEDLTVPQHATDKHGGFPNGEHAEFETAADKEATAKGPNGQISSLHAQSAADLGELYSNPGIHSPGWYVHYAADRSAPHIGEVSGPTTPGVAYSTAHEIVADEMIPLAEKLSALLMKRFWEQWENEEFMVVMTRIDRVIALDGNIDNFGDPDFYTDTKVGNRWYHGGTIIGESNVNPQVVTPYNWFFPKWFEERPDSVPIRIEIWDEDGGLNGGDDKVDVTPVGGGCLDLTYWPANGSVTRDMSAKGPDFKAVGDGDDNAEMRFHIEHVPTVLKGEPVSCTVKGNVTTAQGKPAAGTYVFFRRAGHASDSWQFVKVNTDGVFQIPYVKTSSYEFRPAGSAYDFKGVPKTVKLLPGQNTLNFQAQPMMKSDLEAVVKLLKSQNKSRPERAFLRPASGEVNYRAVQPPSSGPRARSGGGQQAVQSIQPILDTYNQKAAELLEDDALKVQLPGGDFGVKGNGLGYDEWGNVYVHLAAVVDPQTKQPLPDLSSVEVEMVKVTAGSKFGYIPVVKNAEFGAGAHGATVKATLYLGNRDGGYRKQKELTAQTDSGGNATFSLWAGTHPADVHIVVQVMDNPVNPWCKPTVDNDETLLFKPASAGDDLGPYEPYRLQTPVKLADIRKMQARVAVAAANFGFFDGHRADAATRTRAQAALDWKRFSERVDRWRGRMRVMSDPGLVSQARTSGLTVLIPTTASRRQAAARATARAEPTRPGERVAPRTSVSRRAAPSAAGTPSDSRRAPPPAVSQRSSAPPTARQEPSNRVTRTPPPSAERSPANPPSQRRLPSGTRSATRIVEGESLLGSAHASHGPLDRQDMRGFGAGWSGGAQLFWRAPAPVSKPIRDFPSLTFYLDVPKAGLYRLVLYYTQAPDYGDAQVFVKGSSAGEVKGYAPSVRLAQLDLGEHKLAAGKLQVVMTVVGKASASKGFLVGIDRLEIQAR